MEPGHQTTGAHYPPSVQLTETSQGSLQTLLDGPHLTCWYNTPVLCMTEDKCQEDLAPDLKQLAI